MKLKCNTSRRAAKSSRYPVPRDPLTFESQPGRNLMRTPTRREFIKQTAVATFAVASSGRLALAAGTPGRRIKQVIRRDDMIIRHGGNGDIFPLTWMADDRQFGSFSDGSGGWPG